MDSVVAVFSIIISIISLYIAIKAYRLNVPKFKIEIIDSFYGATKIEDGELTNYMAGVRARIKNNSPASFTISDVGLLFNNEYYSLAFKNLSLYANVEFYYFDKVAGITTDGSYVDYENEGLELPFNIKKYDTKDFVSLFVFFIKSDEKKLKAKLIIDTAIGKKKKRVILNKYDYEYAFSEEERSIRQFLESTK